MNIKKQLIKGKVNPTFFIHIGLHQAMSGLLQNSVFALSPEIKLLKKAAHRASNQAYRELINELIYAADAGFSAEKCCKLILEICENQPLEPGNIYGISTAEFSAGPGRFGRHPFSIAGRIREAFSGFEVKIVIDIKAQISLLESFYFEYIKAGGTHSFHNLIFSQFSRAMGLPNMGLYFDFIQHYQQVFGSENVQILVAEELNERPESVLQELFSFLNIRTKPQQLQKKALKRLKHCGISAFALAALRFTNLFFYSPFNNSANLNPITLLVHYLSVFTHLIQSLTNKKYRNSCSTKKRKIHKIKARITTKLRENLSFLIRTVDRVLNPFQWFNFRLNKNLAKYYKNYYSENNQKLEKLLNKNLKQYGYE